MKREPKYQKICRELREQIASGALQDKMPSMRDLSAQYQVSHITALRVFKELQEEGLIENREKSVYVIKKSKPAAKNLVVCLLRSLHSINPQDNFADEILIGAGQAAMDNRFNHLYPQQNFLVNYHGTPDYFFEELVQELEPYLPMVCGILLHAGFTDEQLEKCFLPRFGHIPAVVVGRETSLPLHSVEMPTEAGCREAARLVASSVYSDYILCEICKNTDYRSDHVEFFADELIRNNCAQESIHYCNGISQSVADDEEALNNIINIIDKSAGKPLIFCSSSRGARWLSRHLMDHSYHAGHDYGMIAFDGKGFCYNSSPRIATIKVSGEEIGELAVKALTSMEYPPQRLVAGFKIDINETL